MRDDLMYANQDTNEYDIPDQNRQEVACMCWFPTKGRPFPVSCRYKDDRGVYRSIKDIEIRAMNDTFHQTEYQCEAEIKGKKEVFTLLFYTREMKWWLVR